MSNIENLLAANNPSNLYQDNVGIKNLKHDDVEDAYIMQGVHNSDAFIKPAPTLKDVNKSLLNTTLTPELLTSEIDENFEVENLKAKNAKKSPTKPKKDPAKMVKGVELRKLIQGKEITPSILLQWRRGLNESVIEPTDALIQAISLTNSRKHLLLIALALRASADPNAYVDLGKEGKLHIIAYMYKTINEKLATDKTLTNYLTVIILLMLVMEGSKIHYSVYKNDPNSGRIPETVSNWLYVNRYIALPEKTLTDKAGNLRNLFGNERINGVAIILNKPYYYNGDFKTISIDSYRYAIASLSPIVEKFTLPDHKESGNNVILWDSFQNLYADGFRDALHKSGETVSYQLFAMLLQSAMNFREHKNVISLQEVANMILATLARGYEVDSQEYNILSTLGNDFTTAVQKVYNKPYWLKYAETHDINKLHFLQLPYELRLLSATLNINSTPKVLFTQLKILSEMQGNKITKALQERQQQLMSEKLAYPSEVLSGVPRLELTDKNSKDIFDYGEYDLAYTRDQNGNIYAFTSNMFQQLLETRVNPYNDDPLDILFLVELKYKLASLGRNKHTLHFEPLTISKAIKSLKENDDISQFRGLSRSDDMYKQYLAIALNGNITEQQLSKIDKDKIMKALHVIDYDRVIIKEISNSYAVLILAHIINEIKEDGVQLRLVFDILKK